LIAFFFFKTKYLKTANYLKQMYLIIIILVNAFLNKTEYIMRYVWWALKMYHFFLCITPCFTVKSLLVKLFLDNTMSYNRWLDAINLFLKQLFVIFFFYVACVGVDLLLRFTSRWEDVTAEVTSGVLTLVITAGIFFLLSYIHRP